MVYKEEGLPPAALLVGFSRLLFAPSFNWGKGNVHSAG
jgi:hypothetical protein